MAHHHRQSGDPGPVAEHKAAAAAGARCLIVTISDTRTLETDKSGQRIAELLNEAGHIVHDRRIIPDEVEEIRSLLETTIQDPAIDVIISTGGTGVAKRDVTNEIVTALITRPLPGFGELFRMLSFEEIGSAAMLSGASGGLAQDTVLFALPGSTKAVELGVSRLIVPELGHILGLRRS